MSARPTPTMHPTVLRGATIVDGTGAARRPGDVMVHGGRVVAVDPPGSAETAGTRVVDLDGLVLAPGFIDIHTHYDAQVLWDPDLTPSCWHGVTTVVMGNCGFGIAPTRPEHRETIARTLENVEGMAWEALAAGIRWTFETFPEYLDELDRLRLRLNVAALVGHTPLRLYVLGDDAVERPATATETDEMRALVGDALRAGALGFATSRSPTHSGAAGRPVPSRLAEPDEVFAIAGALRDVPGTIVQVTPGPGLFLDEFARLSRELDRPVTWTALLTGLGAPGSAAALVDRAAALGGEVWPQIACRPLVMQMTLEDPFPLANLSAIKELLARPRQARLELARDASWRERARPEVERAWATRWAKTSIAESATHPELIGCRLDELGHSRAASPFDVLLDVALDDALRTRFEVVLLNDAEDEVAALLDDARTVLGLSDAGAHASQLCDACFSTHLLGHWVRDRATLTLEQAVWRLAGHPAQVFRLATRGRIAPGYVADLVAFDPETVGAAAAERVQDLPGGADRLIVRSYGIEQVWVGGTPIRVAGEDVAFDAGGPGRLLRRGRDT